MAINLGIKDAVKGWMEEKWNNWVKKPIADYTLKTEDQVSQKWNEYGSKAQEQARKPLDYYKKQDAFYRGLFWIAVGCLVVLWMISGS